MLQGSCHWLVVGESAGLSFSTFDSPLVGSVPSCCWCFTLRCFFAFLGLAVLADASTAFAIVSHPHHIQIFYFSVQSALYATSRGLFPNSLLPVPIPANLKFVATPVDRSLVMRALGGAITSPCSNDPESRRPTPTIFGLSPHLLFICWMLLDSPIQITALSGRLLVLFCVYTWLVQLPLYYRIICIVNTFVSADRRATARTTTSLSHAAIRQKKTYAGAKSAHRIHRKEEEFEQKYTNWWPVV